MHEGLTPFSHLTLYRANHPPRQSVRRQPEIFTLIRQWLTIQDSTISSSTYTSILLPAHSTTIHAVAHSGKVLNSRHRTGSSSACNIHRLLQAKTHLSSGYQFGCCFFQKDSLAPVSLHSEFSGHLFITCPLTVYRCIRTETMSPLFSTKSESLQNG